MVVSGQSHHFPHRLGEARNGIISIGNSRKDGKKITAVIITAVIFLWSRKNKTFLVNVQGMSLFLSASPTRNDDPHMREAHADNG